MTKRRYCPVNQSNCYILIIPGFGVISTTISASSNKSVFGQDGPLNENLTQQTMRRKLINYIIQTTLEHILSLIKIMLQCVKTFVKGILFLINNPPITKAQSLACMLNFKSKISLSKRLSMLVGISEAIRLFSTKNNTNLPDKKFFQWLAGLIDGNGCFMYSKKGYSKLVITMGTHDKRCLYMIKQIYGGSIKIKSDKRLAYKLHHKEGLLRLIDNINGFIRNPHRILELGKLCENYNISLKNCEALTQDSAWLSGFFDSQGSIDISLTNDEISLKIFQKNRFILDALVFYYRGTIHPLVKIGGFEWKVNRKDDLSNLMKYFKLNTCKSAKRHRIKMVMLFFYLRDQKSQLAEPNNLLSKLWLRFLNKWHKHKLKMRWSTLNIYSNNMLRFLIKPILFFVLSLVFLLDIIIGFGTQLSFVKVRWEDMSYFYDGDFAGTFEHVINNHSFPSLELLMSFLLSFFFNNCSNYCNEPCAVCEIKKYWNNTTFSDFYGKLFELPQKEAALVMLLYVVCAIILLYFLYRKQIIARIPLWLLEKKKEYDRSSVFMQLVKLLPFQLNLGLGVAIKYIFTWLASITFIANILTYLSGLIHLNSTVYLTFVSVFRVYYNFGFQAKIQYLSVYYTLNTLLLVSPYFRLFLLIDGAFRLILYVIDRHKNGLSVNPFNPVFTRVKKVKYFKSLVHFLSNLFVLNKTVRFLIKPWEFFKCVKVYIIRIIYNLHNFIIKHKYYVNKGYIFTQCAILLTNINYHIYDNWFTDKHVNIGTTVFDSNTILFVNLIALLLAYIALRKKLV